MRLSTLPLPVALILLTSSALPASATASSSVPSSPSLAQPSAFVKPRFLPPPNYRRIRRQDDGSAAAGGGGATDTAATSADGGAGGGDAAQTSAAAATTTTEAAQTTTQEQQQSTTQEATTTQQPTTSEAQTTTQAQQTSPAQTTSAQATTTTQAPTDAATTTMTTAANPASPTPSSDSQVPSGSTTPTPIASSATSASESSAESSLSNVEITYTSLITASDGSVSTATGTTTSQTAVPVKKSGGGSSTGKTWGIIGGVVGGVVVVALGVFVVYRMTQRRFSSLDNDDLEEIKWPELQADGQILSTNTSTLRPLDTHRTGGAGVGDDGASEYGGANGGRDMGASGVYGAVGLNRHQSQSALLDGGALGMTHSRQASYEQLAMADSGGAYGPNSGAGHYDPFLGPAAYPPLQGQGMVYPPPQYLAGASHSAHERSPSLGSQPAADAYGSSPQHAQGYLSRNPTLGSMMSASAYSHHGSGGGEVGGVEPRGAPGAGGAMARVGSPPLGSRSEGAFRVPSPNFGTEEGLGFREFEEKGKEGRGGPL
ncbi:hypothetical protein JCM11251_004946 [Rhodosporidiobolus azoricus]